MINTTEVQHKVKKRGHMAQPAEGFYVDCVCGRAGALRKTKELALADYKSHLPA